MYITTSEGCRYKECREHINKTQSNPTESSSTEHFQRTETSKEDSSRKKLPHERPGKGQTNAEGKCLNPALSSNNAFIGRNAQFHLQASLFTRTAANPSFNRSKPSPRADFAICNQAIHPRAKTQAEPGLDWKVNGKVWQEVETPI